MMRRFFLFVMCSVLGSLSMAQELALETVASGLNQPLKTIVFPTKSSKWLLVVGKEGTLSAIDLAAKGTTKNILDIRDSEITSVGEQGLLSAAFHPDFLKENSQASRKLYVYYTLMIDKQRHSRLSEFSVNADCVAAKFKTCLVEPKSERDLINVAQPQSNHNGGDIVFDSNKLLYLSLGDGGGGNDMGTGHHPTLGNAQDGKSLLGKIIRIDPLEDKVAKTKYRIPGDNPFIAKNMRDEVFALGLRNVFRMGISKVNNMAKSDELLVAADVGQNFGTGFEELNIIEKGKNYGWPFYEGRKKTNHHTTAKAKSEFVEPKFEFVISIKEGRSIIGGFIYHGKITQLKGKYVFGDFYLAKLRKVELMNSLDVVSNIEIPASNMNTISSITRDHDGEILLTKMNGTVSRIVEK